MRIRARTSAGLMIFSLMAMPVTADEMHHGEPHEQHPRDAAVLRESGQAAFAAVREAVRLIEADPSTDWSKVNVDRLHRHLIDMDEVFMRAEVDAAVTATGVRFIVRGSEHTLAAIKRMVPAHASMMDGQNGWRSRTRIAADHVVWSLDTQSATEQSKLRALGFFGLLTLGSHHAPHHLAMARGETLSGH